MQTIRGVFSFIHQPWWRPNWACSDSYLFLDARVVGWHLMFIKFRQPRCWRGLESLVNDKKNCAPVFPFLRWGWFAADTRSCFWIAVLSLRLWRKQKNSSRGFTGDFSSFLVCFSSFLNGWIIIVGWNAVTKNLESHWNALNKRFIRLCWSALRFHKSVASWFPALSAE